MAPKALLSLGILHLELNQRIIQYRPDKIDPSCTYT
jgi:hypothetical protein